MAPGEIVETPAVKWLMSILQIVIVAMGGWLLISVQKLDVRVAQIETNRFTPMDAVQFLKTNVPPAEVRLQLDMHSKDIVEINKALRELAQNQATFLLALEKLELLGRQDGD